MSCHTKGMIFKDDLVRQAVQDNAAFSAAVRNEVKRVYPPKREFRRLQEVDAKRFADAVTEVATVPEPTSLAMFGLGGAMMLIRRRRG
jgi:hypothetical protein